MIKQYFLTGDMHGSFSRFRYYYKEMQEDEHTAIIILGDSGINWLLNEREVQLKNSLTQHYKFRIYCVKGNHDAPIRNVPDMKLIYDDDVHGFVYMQNEWPNIRYFLDYGIYWMNNYRVAVIGGAYSVDKFYRLSIGAQWFSDEQLSPEEMNDCRRYFAAAGPAQFDLVLTHTCPISWEPTDLFLPNIDQSTVDKSMENFLEEMKDRLNWKVWAFAHYHRDRIERPYVEQYYTDTESLDALIKRWDDYNRTGELPLYLDKSPYFDL